MNRALLLIPLLAAALSACNRTELTGPPDLRLGRDECAECGMIINEDRCSSALLISTDGTREHALFDDIGCMLDYSPELPAVIIESFVHDHPTRVWLTAHDATFILADEKSFPTPMGSGLAAFADPAAAQRAADTHAGRTLTFDALPEARREWMRNRFGSPDRAPITPTTHTTPTSPEGARK
jgi:copper chaperone NosL